MLPVFLTVVLVGAALALSAGAHPAPVGVAAPSFYQRALQSYHNGAYSKASAQLDQAAKSASVDAKTRADLLNLRGAIHLRQARTAEALAEFAAARTLNPDLRDAQSPLVGATSWQQFGTTGQKTGQTATRNYAHKADFFSATRVISATSRRKNQVGAKSATLAMVQIVPTPKHSASRAKAIDSIRPGFGLNRRPPAPSANPVIASEDTPPAPVLAPLEEETDDIAPGLLAKKRPAAKPSPAPAEPSAAASPAAASPAPSAAPAAGVTSAPAATPSPDPATPAFLQHYESAYIKFLEKDFAGARALLKEADAIQANQPASIDLRNKIFAYYYKIAYGKYAEKDYTGAQTALDDADAVQKDQPDSLNLRGLIFSRQRVFDQAEVMFKKAVAADPSFWAAKFNMAELPFTYKNYTVARSRYEQLLSETDASKQPREAELTQFKVFLTLLLEGKESAARAFMDHFSFTGSTPARYYCQAALDFYAGNADQASQSISEARKEFPAQIEAIFADSFYRVGWLTDPSKGGTAVASASPAEAPEPRVTPSPAAITAALPANASNNPAAKPTPMLLAAVSPSPTAAPTATVVPKATAAPSPSLTPSPKPTATPAPTETPSPKPTATALPTPTSAPTATATPTAVPTATPKPTIAPTKVPAIVISPAPTTAPTPTVSPSPAPTATARPTATATPTQLPAAETASPAAADQSSPALRENERSPQEDLIRLIAIALVPLYLIGSWIYVLRRAMAIKAERRRPALHYGGGKKPPGSADKTG